MLHTMQSLTKDYTLCPNDFLKYPIKDILGAFHLSPSSTVCVSHTRSINYVLDKFHKCASQCALVRKRSSVCKRLLGCPSCEYAFFDLADFVHHVVQQYKSRPSETFGDLFKRIGREKVWNIAYESKRNPFVPNQDTDPFSAVVLTFAITSKVPIFHKNKLIRVLSGIDLLAIFKEARLLPKITSLESTVRNVQKTPVTLMQSESVLKAMTLIQRYNFSSIPIMSLNKEKKVLDIFTVNHVKYLLMIQARQSDEDILNISALEYMHHLQKKVLATQLKKMQNLKVGFLTVQDNLSFMDIVDKMIDEDVTRIVFENSDNHMTGFLTISDIINAVVSCTTVLTHSAKIQEIGMTTTSHPYTICATE